MPIDRLLAKQQHASLSTPRQWPSRNLFSIHSTPAPAVHQCCGNPHEPSVPTRRIANVRRGWAWQRFRLPWQPVDQGEEVQLCVRAIEAAGAGQPPAGARNAIHTVQIVVR